ncbi:MAG: YdbL family protein [Chlorobium sp.]
MKALQKNLFKAVVVAILVVGMGSHAFALDLETARSSGLAGEVDNGLLAAPPGASSAAKDLINSTNNARRAEYARIAAQNNLSLEAVGTLASQKIFAKIPAGTWIQVQGTWKKKAE